MPKTRAYTRDELQGLRRADLQRLCKTYDIKGANAKSEVLIDTLATYFTSPAYLSSPRPDRARPRAPPTKTRTARPTAAGALPLSNLPRRAARTKQPPAEAPAAQVDAPPNPSQPIAPPRRTDDAMASLTNDKGSVPTSLNDRPIPIVEEAHASEPPLELPDVPALRREVNRLQDVISKWQEEEKVRVERLVESKIEQQLEAATKRQMALVEQREAAVKRREDDLEAAWRQLEAKLRSLGAKAQAVVDGSPEPSLRPYPPSTGEKRRHPHEESASPHKRARLEVTGSPHTPTSTLHPPALDQGADHSSPPNFPPRTPSPMTDPSSAHANNHPAAGSKGPKFATTPLPPAEAPSPTTDHMDLVTRRNAPPPPILTTAGAGFGSSRSRVDLSSRKAASKAHMDLATITDESVEAAGPASFFGPILMRKDRTLTPPALSPSPSIGGDNYTFTPMPLPTMAASDPNPTARREGAKTPPTCVAPSPRREYMDVALNGLVNDSPGAIATPNSRTLLGTERYRDTRFGDEPFVPWTSPTVDCGLETPTH